MKIGARNILAISKRRCTNINGPITGVRILINKKELPHIAPINNTKLQSIILLGCFKIIFRKKRSIDYLLSYEI